jgi:hypothetical protein
VFGVLFLLLAGRTWRSRPASGGQAQMPKWMAGINTFAPGEAFVLGLLLAGVNPKNPLLAAGAGSALAVVGPSGAEAAVALIVFIVAGSLTIIGPSSTAWPGAKAPGRAWIQLRQVPDDGRDVDYERRNGSTPPAVVPSGPRKAGSPARSIVISSTTSRSTFPMVSSVRSGWPALPVSAGRCVTSSSRSTASSRFKRGR